MRRHFRTRGTLAVWLVALLVPVSVVVLLPDAALAAPKKAAKVAKKPIAVGVIEGPQGGPTRKRVLKVLKESDAYEVTDAEDLRPGGAKAAYAAMASALQVQAIVVGRVSRRLDLALSIHGADGALIEEVKIKGGSAKALDKAIDNELEIMIAEPLGGIAAAKEEPKPKPKAKQEPEDEEPEDEEDAEPEDEEPKDEEDESKATPATEEAAEPARPGPQPFELLVGARVYQRRFNYVDLRAWTPPQRDVRPYTLNFAPAIIASTRLYPFAFFQDDAWAHVGLTGRLEIGIGTTTNYQQPNGDGTFRVTELATGTTEWQLGLRGRLPMGVHELGVFGVYGSHSFILVGDEGPSVERPDRLLPIVPDVDYRFLRMGVDARVRVSKLTVGGHLAPRFLLSMHNVDLPSYWFPGATGSGFDFGIFGAYGLLSFLDLAVGIDYVRYGFDFNAIPDSAAQPNLPAPVIAGGATDTYLSAWFGLILHLGGEASGGDGALSVEASAGK